MKMVKQISEKRRRSDLFISMGIAMLLCLYFGIKLGYCLETLSGEEKNLFFAISVFTDDVFANPFKLFPTNIGVIGIGIAAGLIIDVLLYNEYLRVKDTVEQAHGDAAFEEDYKQYDKEFVFDPKLFGDYLKRKVVHLDGLKGLIDSLLQLFRKNTINAPYNEEHKAVMTNIPHGIAAKAAIREAKRRSMIYTEQIYLSMNGKWTQRNYNSIIFGASGAGKSRYFLKPNLLQAYGSYVVTDPSGDILVTCGDFLANRKGYKVKCLNVDNMEKSCRFNPLYYIRSVKDIPIIVRTFMENTKTEGKSSGGDDFWEKSTQALLCATIGYLYEVCPMEQRNFANVLEIIRMDSRDEDDDPEQMTDFDVLFQTLGEQNPTSYAYNQYRTYRQAPAKTALNILISTGVLLSTYIDIPEFKNLTYKDEMELDRIGQEEMAIFLIIPQADKTYSWITAMLYSLLFKNLYLQGEERMEKEGLTDPELKVPVRFLIDECANIGKISDLDKYLATCRKYNMGIVPIFQNYSQIVEIYGKEKANGILSNCDAFLFLGGMDADTLKIVTERLGKETVKTLSGGISKGRSGSVSSNKQQTGKELMSRSQVERMSNAECLLFIRALRPFKTKKFELSLHENYRYYSDGKDGKIFANPFVLEYEDDLIESVRIKNANEDGYIMPEIVDSARRRALVAENKQKVLELNKMFVELETELEQKMAKNRSAGKDDYDGAKRIQAKIERVKSLIEKYSRTDENAKNVLDTGRGFDGEECDETKEKEEVEGEEISQMEITEGLAGQNEVTLLDSFSPLYEFDEASDFRIEDLLAIS